MAHDQPVDVARRLDVGQVRGVDNRELRSRDVLGERPGVRVDRGGRVERAGDQQGRRGDPAQRADVVPRLDRLATAEVAVVRGLSDPAAGRSDRLQVPLGVPRGEPPLHHRLGDRGRAAGADRRDPVPPRAEVGEAGRRAAQHKRADPLRRLGGQPHSDHAAKGQPAPRHPVDAEPVQQRQRVRSEIRHPVRARQGPVSGRARDDRSGSPGTARPAPGSAVATCPLCCRASRTTPRPARPAVRPSRGTARRSQLATLVLCPGC